MFLNKTFYYNVFDLFVPFFKIDSPPLSVKLLNLNMTSWQI